VTVLAPRPIRRLLTVPVTLLATGVVVGTLPLTLPAAAVAGLVERDSRFRALRVLVCLAGWLSIESWALLALGSMWLDCDRGRTLRTPENQRRHYVLIETYLDAIYRLVSRTLNVRVRIEGVDPGGYRNRPLLVFARHAGPGDSLLIVHALVSEFGREPRVVLKDALQWAPAIDIALNRLPNRFITAPAKAGDPPGEVVLDRPEDAIATLATRLDGDDALVLFPEGGNFTVRRRDRSIQSLLRKGMRAEARKAARMRYVLAPRPGGVLAALANAPEADVLWVGHTGADHVMSPGDVWREIPLQAEIVMHFWTVPTGEIPTDPDEQVAWLYAWWQRIDDWIAGRRDPDLPDPG
jgi:1-acyl-sn-glycerol-3-phosphate acyltransferase